MTVSYCNTEDKTQWLYHTATQRMKRNDGIILQHRGWNAWRYHTATQRMKRNDCIILQHTGWNAMTVSYCKTEDETQWQYHTATQRMKRSDCIILQHRGWNAVTVSHCNTEAETQWRYHIAKQRMKRSDCIMLQHKWWNAMTVSFTTEDEPQWQGHSVHNTAHNHSAIFLSAGLTAVNLASLMPAIRKRIWILNINLQFLQ